MIGPIQRVRPDTGPGILGFMAVAGAFAFLGACLDWVIAGFGAHATTDHLLWAVCAVAALAWVLGRFFVRTARKLFQ